MVDNENISLSLTEAQALITAAYVERHKAGGWTLVLELNGDIAIDETRSLAVRRDIRVGKLVQKGRRPLPANVQEALKKGLRSK